MRKKTIILGLIEIIWMIYGYVAWSSTRGLRIYMISYQMGEVFQMSCLPVALLVIVGLLVEIRFLKKDIRAIKEKRKLSKPETSFSNAAGEENKTISTLCHCPGCGVEVEAGQKFCTKCGTKIE